MPDLTDRLREWWEGPESAGIAEPRTMRELVAQVGYDEVRRAAGINPRTGREVTRRTVERWVTQAGQRRGQGEHGMTAAGERAFNAAMARHYAGAIRVRLRDVVLRVSALTQRRRLLDTGQGDHLTPGDMAGVVELLRAGDWAGAAQRLGDVTLERYGIPAAGMDAGWAIPELGELEITRA